MRVALVHYHARPGGVTRVVSSAVAALGNRTETVFLAGEPDDFCAPDVKAFSRPVDGLGYREEPGASADSGLAGRLIAAANDALGGPPDLWHIHNHSLGKNPSFTQAVYELARRGERMLLQIHDFAEDGRPHNYALLRRAFPDSLRETMYPGASHVHYAVLNGRDRRLLIAAGLDPAQVHLLPNPVSVPELPDAAAPSGNRRLWVYPVRAIRRKNIGELLFWRALADPDDRFAVTLAPRNPRAQEIYRDWLSFADEAGLEIDFDATASGQYGFEELIAESTALVTTSIAEGFGMAFLEPWLFGRPLAGRDLPEITADFKDQGVQLGGLYSELRVPAQLIDLTELRRRIGSGMRQLCGAYAAPFSEARTEQAYAAAAGPEGVGFGFLDEDLQREVIRNLISDAGLRAEMNPLSVNENFVGENRATVQAAYSLESYGDRLARLYHKIAGLPAGPVGAALDADLLLNEFLAPERFRLLRGL